MLASICLLAFGIAAAASATVPSQTAAAITAVTGIRAECRPYQQPSLFPLGSGLAAVAVTPDCSRAFASDPVNNLIRGVDLVAGRMLPAIRVGDAPLGIDVSSDGSILFVAVTEGIDIVDLGTGTYRQVTIPELLPGERAFSLATASNGMVLMTTTSPGSGYAARLVQFNPSTGAFPIGGSRTAVNGAVAQASGDHSHVVLTGVGPGGEIYAAPTGLYAGGGDIGSTPAMDRYGQRLVGETGVGTTVYDEQGYLGGYLVAQIPGAATGLAMDASGDFVYRLSGAGIETLDVRRGLRSVVVPLPDSPQVSVHGLNLLASSSDRSLLVAITDNGVVVVTGRVGPAPAPACPTAGTGNGFASVSGTLNEIVFDPTSQHVYASNGTLNEVEVYDVANRRLECPIAVGPNPHGLDVSPDGRYLYVADSGSDLISVVDLQEGVEVNRLLVPRTGAAVPAGVPWEIGVAANGKAIVSTYIPGSNFTAVWKINLSDNSSEPLPVYFATQNTTIRSSGDHSRVVLAVGNYSMGQVYEYHAATDSVTAFQVGSEVQQVATSWDGSTTLLNTRGDKPYGWIYLHDASGQLKQMTIPNLGSGISPSGTTGYLAEANRVDVVNVAQWTVTGTVAVPDTMTHPVWLANTFVGGPGEMATSPDGTELALITDNGFSVVAIPAPDTPPQPLVSVTSPGPGQAVNRTVTVVAGAVAQSGIASVQLSSDGQPLGPALTAAPYTYQWDTARFSNGTHSLQAVATDTSGQKSVSVAVSVTVNHSPTLPAVSDSIPAKNDTAGTTIPVRIRFNEEVLPSTIAFALTDASGTPVPVIPAYVPTQNMAVYTPVSPLAPGTQYTIRLSSAQDGAGDTMAPDSWTFITEGQQALPQPPPGSIGAAAVASWAPGRLDLFVRGKENSLWHTFSVGAGGFAAWENLGGQLSSAPVAISWAANRIDVFVRGTDRALWHKWWSGANWSGWESLGGVSMSSPAVASWATGRLDVVVRGSDNAVWHKWWTGAAWSGWETLGGVCAGDPGATSWGPGALDVFCLGGTVNPPQLWHKFWRATLWSGWTQEVSGGWVQGATATSPSGNRIEVFGVDPNSWLRRSWWDGAAWRSENQGLAVSSTPAAASWSPNHVALVIRGTDGNLTLEMS